MSKEVFLIVALGNPGEKYAHTRHNAGFDTMDLLAKHYGAVLNRNAHKGLIAEVTDAERRIVLCEPQTFMNASGECVRALLDWYGCEPDHLLVIYDDIDLPLGYVRVRRNGGPGTHNGMRSIAENLPDTAFPRIRVGTGDRPEGWDLVDWVLGRVRDPEEKKAMDKAFQLAADCAADWVENGIDSAIRKAACGMKKDE
jgi:PTH1 family peptidyl-tRNA hydrolase